MALISNTGKVLYSDLSRPAMSRISPFYDSMLIMGLGDNLSLALDNVKTIIASRISNRAILIALTDKKVGIVLTKMSGVADKFGRLLDELITMDESRSGPDQSSRNPTVETVSSYNESSSVVEEVQTSNTVQPQIPQEEQRQTQYQPQAQPEPKIQPQVRPEPKIQPPPQPETKPKPKAPQSTVAVAPVTAQRKSMERVTVPVLTDPKVLEKCPDKDRRFLELFDGNLSLNEIARRLGVPYFDALQVANKYKNARKVEIKEVFRG